MGKFILEVKNGESTQKHTVESGNLHSILAGLGYQITAPCGGEGRCGKCKVIVNNIEVLACKTQIKSDMFVEIPCVNAGGLLQGVESEKARQISSEEGVSVALDIGTTTLAFYFLDNKTGEEKYSFSCLNPQCSYGADVVSRISLADKYLDMFEVLKDKINEVIGGFLNKNKEYSEVSKIVVCGNTTMSHIFAKENPKSMGVSPFPPVFLERREFSGEELEINAKHITLMPSISAFVGGDITSGVIATNLENGTNLLIDIGTNGEMVASKNGKLFGTATAAGPAFEGGNISCGVGGIEGAISKVEMVDGKAVFETIGGRAPIGICGSGLFDCIGCLLDEEILDETGYMDEDFAICESVSVTKKDIREFQVGKSAIASGVKVLLMESGISEDEIENVYIAGGMGFYLNPKAIVKVGLLSETLASKITAVGNSAGSGAKACLFESANLEKCDKICEITKIVDLGGSTAFNNEFAMNMMLESVE